MADTGEGPETETVGKGAAVQPLLRGRYRARMAVSSADIGAAQALRGLCFRGGGLDEDQFDAVCDHVLVEDVRSGALACCYRLLTLEASEIGTGYAGQVYDLSRLARQAGPMVELGRFCVDPVLHDPDVLRVAWGAMAAYVDARGATFLFGCASFAGVDVGVSSDALALLGARYRAPEVWAPGEKAPEVFRLAACLGAADAAQGMRQMPALMRTYLAMGGRVSDHAVIDREMNTHHVFTGVEIAAIPEARKRALRAVAG